MNLSAIFFGDDNTIRSGWRAAIFVVLFVLLGQAAATVAYILLTGFGTPSGPGSPAALAVNGAALLTAALMAGWLCAKLLERLPFRSLGAAFTDGWLRNFLVGMLVGACAFALAALIGVAGGGLSFRWNTEASGSAIGTTLIVSFIVFTAAAAFEEALLRGYLLQTFLRSGLGLFAVFFTSVVFAMLHNTNPNATWLSWINTFLAGIWMAVAYLKTRDLWMPLGVHLGWNWAQGPIFGVEVSGLAELAPAPLMRETDLGPTWLTGGDYGIEGGIACTLALIVAIAAVHFFPGVSSDPELIAMTSLPSTKLETRESGS
jgi:uncharacterized protein